MAPTKRVLGSDIGVDTWKLYRNELDQEFVKYCDNLLNEARAGAA